MAHTPDFPGTTDQPTEAGAAPVQRAVMVEMRDSIRLATDIHFPSVDGRRLAGSFPVILERTPYGKDQPSRSERTAGRSEPFTREEVAEFFTRDGYVVVYQDCRGSHGSEGEFTKYLDEARDGYDTCAWIVRQPWCNGSIGTKGLSYAAHTQMALGSLGAPGVKAMFVDSGGFSSAYHSGVRQGGAYELKQAAWACEFATMNRRGTADAAALPKLDLEHWFARMPWRRGASPLSGMPEYEDFLFDQWEREEFGDYWKQAGIYAQGHYDALGRIASVQMSSWYDPYSRTAIENFIALSKRNGDAVRLVMGPWIHGNRWESHAGDVDFGPQAILDGQLAPDFLTLRKRWFDRCLKGAPQSHEDLPAVSVFVMGGGSGRKNAAGRLDHGGRWRRAPAWPLAQTRQVPYFLQADGSLSTGAPPAGASPRCYEADPSHPVPTIGGAVVTRPPRMVAGAFDQREDDRFFGCAAPGRALSERADVLVFQTEPLAENVEVIGSIVARLWVSSDCPDTDFTVKLIDMHPPSEDYPEGFAMNLTDGICRAKFRNSWEHPSALVTGLVYQLDVEALPTSNLFLQGHRIRLDISGSNFPKFDVNPNTGEAVTRATTSVVARNRIHMDEAHPSHVVLPTIPPDAP